MKPKKCRSCRESFTPYQPLQIVCSPRCAMAYAAKQAEAKREKEARARRKQTREQLEALKTVPMLTKEAQSAFNAFIRARDEGLPCISCTAPAHDRHLTGGSIDCGHYLSTGSAPELRFEEDNAHAQCKRCNQYLSGNAVYYRIGLIRKIGLERVEWLEGPHAAKNYTRDELRGIRDHYKAKLKELRKAA